MELAGGTLSVSVAGETWVELTFSPDAEVDVRGRAEPVARVRFFADDPAPRSPSSASGSPAVRGDDAPGPTAAVRAV